MSATDKWLEARGLAAAKVAEEFRKDDAEKLRLELVPPELILAVGRAVTYGAKKYGAQNWDKCKDPTRYLGAFLRHTFSHMGGEIIDKESGLNHLDCAAASLGFYVALTERAK